MDFLKGHGTENDFVVLPDPAGACDLTPALVRALCDRRAGIGGDGVLRVVRTEHAPAGSPVDAEWFMDYRNADGSAAEMCGNGIRVYARYLVDAGLAAPGELRLGTRAGTRVVRLDRSGDVTVDMGRATVLGPASAVLSGRPHPGVCVHIGNPHLVCAVDQPLERYDLTEAPAVAADIFPDGANVELVTTLGDRHLRMRVFERGVGETRSCGTGACAVAVAAAAGAPGPDWTVDVPGGRLTVAVRDDGVRLTGPAVIVGRGELDPAWLARAGAEVAPG